MFKIVKKEYLTKDIFSLWIEAPRVAKSGKPGQFVIIIADEKGERIPLTISDIDKNRGLVEVVFQTLGQSTKKIVSYDVGDYLKDFVGPLGAPSEFLEEDIEELKKKNILFVGGGVGAAPVYPQVKWFHEQGIDVDVILGARNKDLLILEDKFKEVTPNLYITTDDGSYGYKGMVTNKIEELIVERGKDSYDHVVAIGPLIMMKFVSQLTKKYNIPTTVSLNPIMVDGTGMCGACRVSVDNQTKFACVHGPEFDGHTVDFDEAMKRQAQYKDLEVLKDRQTSSKN